MTILVALQHRTTYTFDRPVTVHPHTVRLRPAPHSRTPVTAYSLTVHPSNHFVNWQQDPFGNHLARLVFPERVTELDVTVDLVADLTVINPFDFFVEDYAEHHGFAYPPDLRADLDPYLRPVDEGGPGSGPGAAVRAFMAERGLAATRRPRAAPEGIVNLLVRVNAAVAGSIAYSVRMEPGVLTPTPPWPARSAPAATAPGCSSRSCARWAWPPGSSAATWSSSSPTRRPPTAGRPARAPTSPTSTPGPRSSSRAPAGSGSTPPRGCSRGRGTSRSRRPPPRRRAAPISGATEPSEVTFSFSNTVTRLHEDPRVTRPYDDAQWAAVDALGERSTPSCARATCA